MSQQVIEIHGAKRALAEAEARIEKATRRAFYDLGTELRGIRENELYSEGFDTFEDYCRERWGWTMRRVEQLMQAARALDGMRKNFRVLPSVESHVFNLLPLPDPDTRAEVWGRVVDVSQQTGERITARLVKQEADPPLDRPGLLNKPADCALAQQITSPDPDPKRPLIGTTPMVSAP